MARVTDEDKAMSQREQISIQEAIQRRAAREAASQTDTAAMEATLANDAEKTP